MASQIFPTQLGYTPVGSSLGSQITLGRDTSFGDVTFEAIGVGAKGRPDSLEKVVINISKLKNADGVNSTYDTVCDISLNIADILALAAANSNFPKDQSDNTLPTLSLRLTEVSTCETDDSGNGVEKRMVILASQTYLPAPDAPPSS